MDRNARHRKCYAKMPEHEKADLLCSRRDANAAKKRKLSLPNIRRENGLPLCEGECSEHVARTSLDCFFPGCPF